MNTITMIPVDNLLHHPENPRKDLGDLTELAESIRANGVMQNLTVVADPETSKYLVVIGNRRMEAAKLAGLAEVPCVISDMDHRTQVATMLMENMQRQDLTVYEQAQGFQMMMDLGYTAKEIGEKTGFSEKTVRDRIKFTKFNQKNFEKAVQQGATLMDMIEISKLESKTDQNEVMKEAGTNNFRQALNRKLEEQTYRKNCEKLEKIAKEEGLEAVPESMNTWDVCDNLGTIAETSESEDKIRKAVRKVIKENKGTQVLYRFGRRWNNAETMLQCYKMKDKTAKEPTEAEKAQKEKERARQKQVRTVKKLCAEAYKLRTDFIRNYTVTNGFGMTTIAKLIMKYSLQQQNAWNKALPERHDWKEKYIKETLGIEKEEYEDKKSLLELIEARGIPMIRATIAWMMGGGVFDCDSPENGSYYYYDGSFQNSEQMMKRYEFLKQLLDGTHECYGTAERS